VLQPFITDGNRVLARAVGAKVWAIARTSGESPEGDLDVVYVVTRPFDLCLARRDAVTDRNDRTTEMRGSVKSSGVGHLDHGSYAATETLNHLHGMKITVLGRNLMNLRFELHVSPISCVPL
jgi:hypothetical protein